VNFRLVFGQGVALLASTLVVLAMSTQLHGASCKQKEYEIRGTVTDRAGTPIRGARVHVLLDKISKKEFGKQGIRVRSVTANDRGGYQIRVTCGENPNPCASKPKHLSLAASKHGYAMVLQTVALKELEIAEQDGICFIRAPVLHLRAGF